MIENENTSKNIHKIKNDLIVCGDVGGIVAMIAIDFALFTATMAMVVLTAKNNNQ